MLTGRCHFLTKITHYDEIGSLRIMTKRNGNLRLKNEIWLVIISVFQFSSQQGSTFLMEWKQTSVGECRLKNAGPRTCTGQTDHSVFILTGPSIILLATGQRLRESLPQRFLSYPPYGSWISIDCIYVTIQLRLLIMSRWIQYNLVSYFVHNLWKEEVFYSWNGMPKYKKNVHLTESKVSFAVGKVSSIKFSQCNQTWHIAHLKLYWHRR